MNPDTDPKEGLSGSLEDVLAVKKTKLKELRDRGVDCFPPRFEKTHTCGQVLALGKPLEIGGSDPAPVRVAGRLVGLRDMGKSIFGHIQDGTDKCQVYFKKDALPEDQFGLVKKDLHAGDFIGAAGAVFKTRTGEPTVAAAEVTLLAKALRPMPEKFHGLKDVETRYRHRHLDLIASPEARKIFKERSLIVST
ncbi:MAG: OB-fold nucleic acid binding domain-containing protein, partial [Elusimicrobiota bacterium]